MAIDRAGVSGTPRLPSGGPSSRRKKTTDWLWRRTRLRSDGFSMSHLRMASIETVSSVSRPSSIRSRPMERYGRPFE